MRTFLFTSLRNHIPTFPLCLVIVSNHLEYPCNPKNILNSVCILSNTSSHIQSGGFGILGTYDCGVYMQNETDFVVAFSAQIFQKSSPRRYLPPLRPVFQHHLLGPDLPTIQLLPLRAPHPRPALQVPPVNTPQSIPRRHRQYQW